MFTRHRGLPVERFDANTDRWTVIDGADAGRCDHLTVTTFNIWFDAYFAEERFQAIADLLSRNKPDIMVFQEVTPAALGVFLGQSWIRADYLSAAIVGHGVGNYGMLMLSRIPINRVSYVRLPTRMKRGYLTAEFTINGRSQTIVSAHLDSGNAAARRRARQLRRIFRAMRTTDNVIVLGDFNMRDNENDRIDKSYCDIWPALRPHDDGFTEDTSINLMRLDSKNKHRQVRFDRALLKGAGWRPRHIELLGCEPISSSLPRVFPSDHFGVWCRFVRSAAPLEREVTNQATGQRFWRHLLPAARQGASGPQR